MSTLACATWIGPVALGILAALAFAAGSIGALYLGAWVASRR